MAKLFKTAFAYQGTKEQLPDAAQPDGKASFAEGFTADYTLDYGDSDSRDIAQSELNGIFHDITEAVGELQKYGVAVWQTDMSPIAKYSLVFHDAKLWQAKTNTSTQPAQGANWQQIDIAEIASQLASIDLSNYATKTYVENSVAGLASVSYVDNGLATKATATVVNSQLAGKFDKTDVAQSSGQSTTKVMSQKVVSDAIRDIVAGTTPTLSSIGDVDAYTPSNGDTIVYSSATDKWEATSKEETRRDVKVYGETFTWSNDDNGTSDSTMARLVQTIPASSTSTGKVGQLAADSDYIYYCYATDSWAKVYKSDFTSGGIDANKITSGILDIARIPPAAIERLVVVADSAARFSLTTAEVQKGDVVKETDTGLMYYVFDDTNLNNSNGYEEFTAGKASSVPWFGITDKPTTIAGYGLTDAVSNTEVNAQLAGKFDKTDVAQSVGQSSTKVMSQKAVTDAISGIVGATVTWDMESDTYSGNPFATPVHKNMRRCLLKNGEVQYYLNEFDSTLKEDGEPAVTNGTDGQVMVEIQPCYVKTTLNGNLITWQVSHAPIDGFVLHPAFDDEDDRVYIGAYDAVVWRASSNSVINGLNLDNNTANVNLSNDLLYSTPGNYAMVGLTRAEFRQLARNHGYQLYDYWQWQLVQLLYLTEFGNWNSQAMVGNGNVNGAYVASSSNQADSPHTINGLSNVFGNHSGSITDGDGAPVVTYRGIENLWGNAWQWCDGVNVNNRQMYVCNDPDKYADDTTTNYTALGDPLPLATSSAFIKKLQLVETAFIPATVGGGASSDSFITDMLTTGAVTGWRTMGVGGGARGALADGVSCCDVSTAFSSRGRDVSARLSKKVKVA